MWIFGIGFKNHSTINILNKDPEIVLESGIL